MNYCHTIYYNLNDIKNDLINLIQKFGIARDSLMLILTI